MKIIFALLAGFVSVSAYAATQSIDCRFVDQTNTDHVMVALTSDQAGTFFYSSSDDEPATSSTDKLLLKRAKNASSGFAAFMAEVVIPEGSGSVQFTFEYPETQIMKVGSNVKAKLTTQIFGITASADTQDLICSAKVN